MRISCRWSSLPTWPRMDTRHPPLNWSGEPQVDFSRRIFSGSTFATSTSIGTRADGRFKLKKTPLSENQTWPVASIHSPLRMYPPRRSALLTGRYIGDCAFNSKAKPQLVRRKTNTTKTNCDLDIIVRAARGRLHHWREAYPRPRLTAPSIAGLRVIQAHPSQQRLATNVRFGSDSVNSAMAAQCPVCPKADKVERFVSTRRNEYAA
jgi:hypothetical protein